MNGITAGRQDAQGWWVLRGAAALALVGALLAALGWHYSEMILAPDHPPTLHEQRVLAAGSGRIRLSRDQESIEPGTWALQWPGGFGTLGAVVGADDRSVVREFSAVQGQPPVGGWASVRGVSRSADPQNMLDLPFESVAFDGPLGRYPAWFVPGGDSTWVVYVHGRGANRAEGLRTLGVLAGRGLPGLLVTYRNDAGAPAAPDGLYHLGLTEWQDLEAAIRYATAHGAREVVLAGYSMGGQIVLQLMERSALAAHVGAIVLESPTLDWNATVACRARAMHVPGLATWLGKQTATLRASLDWDRLDRTAHVAGLTVPILIFHGLDDTFAPESVSEAFARALPGNATLVRIRGGNHVEAWNTDRAAYAETLDRWLSAHGIGSGRP
jgi:hypothetical protein